MGKNQSKTVRITVVCSQELAAELERLAELDQRPVSQWIRRELGRIVGQSAVVQRFPSSADVEADLEPGPRGAPTEAEP